MFETCLFSCICSARVAAKLYIVHTAVKWQNRWQQFFTEIFFQYSLQKSRLIHNHFKFLQCTVLWNGKIDDSNFSRISFLILGAEKVRSTVLWNGKIGDGNFFLILIVEKVHCTLKIGLLNSCCAFLTRFAHAKTLQNGF